MGSKWLEKVARTRSGEFNSARTPSSDADSVITNDLLMAELADAREALMASEENEHRLRLLVEQAKSFLTDAKHRIELAEARAEALQAELDEVRAERSAWNTSSGIDAYEAELQNLRRLLDGAGEVKTPVAHETSEVR